MESDTGVAGHCEGDVGVEIVRSIYEAHTRGDWDAAFRLEQRGIHLSAMSSEP